MRTIKAVQDELEKLGTELLIVLAPGKASMFPENIPNSFFDDSTGINNNAAYQAAFRGKGSTILILIAFSAR